VIGSRSGEIPWVIGDAGLLFPEDDVQELRQCLHRLQEDARLRQELADKGRTRVLERFTQEKVARDTWEAYQQVLGL
jgi:glycosyltransferase involved in cell wall biosynthesis